MKEILFFIVLLIGFYIHDKFKIYTYLTFQQIVKNIMLILPVISLLFSKDKITTMYSNYKVKRNITQTKKKIVASNQRWHCNMCMNMLDYTYEIDHIIPLYKGGNNNLNNLQALCRNCHGKKTIYDKYN